MPATLPELVRLAVERHLGASTITEVTRLSGGASQESWRFDAQTAEETLPLILRRSPARGRGEASISSRTEAALQRIAEANGVPVATVYFVLDDDDRLGDGYVMRRLEGETLAPRILRREDLAGARARMARQCGGILGRIHSIELESLPPLRFATAAEQLDHYRRAYEAYDEPRPLFDLAFLELEDLRPEVEEVSLVHGDFRNGNLVVDEEGIRAVLDWELAHLGDPYEDLGWLCVNSWRFGHVEKPVGGFGTYGDLYAGYREVIDVPMDAERLRFWEIFGSLKWGVMCMMQAFSTAGSESPSVEKTAIGRRVSETEIDLLRALAPSQSSVGPIGRESSPWRRQERPDLGELLRALRGFLDQARESLDGRQAFHARVAANVVGVVERELDLGPELDRAEREGLEALLAEEGTDLSVLELNRKLCQALRSGHLGRETSALWDHLQTVTEAKLAIDNPRYRSRPEISLPSS